MGDRIVFGSIFGAPSFYGNSHITWEIWSPNSRVLIFRTPTKRTPSFETAILPSSCVCNLKSFGLCTSLRLLKGSPFCGQGTQRLGLCSAPYPGLIVTEGTDFRWILWRKQEGEVWIRNSTKLFCGVCSLSAFVVTEVTAPFSLSLSLPLFLYLSVSLSVRPSLSLSLFLMIGLVCIYTL